MGARSGAPDRTRPHRCLVGVRVSFDVHELAVDDAQSLPLSFVTRFFGQNVG